MMKRHIQLTAHARKKLAEELGVSDSYIYDAIYYRRNGEVAKMIRNRAIALGGRYMEPEFVPDCRTEYLDGQIRQTFATDVVLTIDRETGKAVITIEDEVIRRVDIPVRMSQWDLLTQEAQRIAAQRVISE